jgi:hypothetical protein
VEPLVDEGGGPPDIYEDDGVCEDEEEEEVTPPPSSPPAPPPAAEVVGGGVKRPQVKAEPREQEEKHQPAARHFLDELLEDFTVRLVTVIPHTGSEVRNFHSNLQFEIYTMC